MRENYLEKALTNISSILALFLQMYADMLERQQEEGKDFGGQLSEEQLTSVNEEQLHQLFALHQEITTPSNNSSSTGRS